MPDEPNLSHWPPIWKHQELLAHLFERISFSDRDTVLEAVLAKSIPKEENATDHAEDDLIEASRRLREAVRDDAYMRWAPADRDAIAQVFLACREASEKLRDLEKHNLKTLTITTKRQEIRLYDLHQQLMEFADLEAGLTEDIRSSVPTATKATNTIAFSLVERLAEAWKVLCGSEPSLNSASGVRVSAGFNSGAPFQDCLQLVADHLGVKASNGAAFKASSALKAWKRNNGAKRPADDSVEL